MARGINTKCTHLEEDEQSIKNYGAISYPIYQTATYAHMGVGRSTGFDYSRLQNPTREQLEKVVASLENGIDAIAFSTGMAAITMMMELFKPGDHLIVDSDLYGGSIRLFHNVSAKNGIEFSSVDCYKEDVESFVKENTKAIYIETPTNPMMNVTDIAAMAEIAKRHDLLLIVDNTFLSPYFQNPLDLGADIVVHSGTKYLGGHNDTLAGFLVTNREVISEKFRFLIKTVGSGLAPFDSWLILRGIKTLGATVFAILISAFGSNHQKVRRNDRSTFCGFDNLQTGAKSIRRGMARAGNHTVYVARFKHKRAEHGIVFFNRFVSEFFRHALFFAEFVKKFGVSLGFFVRKRIDYRNAGQIHVGVIGFDFGFVAEQHYFGDSFFYGIGSGFYDTFVFAFGKNYRLTERGGSFFNIV